MKKLHWTQTIAGKKELAELKVKIAADKAHTNFQNKQAITALNPLENTSELEKGYNPPNPNSPTLREAISKLQRRIDSDTSLVKDLENLLSELENFKL